MSAPHSIGTSLRAHIVLISMALIVGVFASSYSGLVQGQSVRSDQSEVGQWRIIETKVGIFKLDSVTGRSFIYNEAPDSAVEWALIPERELQRTTKWSPSFLGILAQYFLDRCVGAENDKGEKIGAQISKEMYRADCAEFRKGDIITKVNGVRVDHGLHVWGEIAYAVVDKELTFALLRDGEPVTINIVFPREDDHSRAELWICLFEKSKIAVDGSGKPTGLMIPEQFKFSDTELRAGDIVIEAQGDAVTSAMDLLRLVRKAREDKKTEVEIVYLRANVKLKTNQKLAIK